MDWKFGAMALGFLGILGLRKTDLGETLTDIPNQIDGWLDDNLP